MKKILITFLGIFENLYRNSSLHVFYYKAQIKNDNPIIWTTFCCGSVGLAVWSIYSSIFSFVVDNRPIITIITQNFPYEFVIFPCVSICNYNKVSKREFQIIDKLLVDNNVSRDEVDNFAKSLQYLVSLEAFNYENKIIENHTNIFQLLRNNNYSVEALMYQVHPRCERMMRTCLFQSKTFDCMSMIKTVKTAEGYCCSFNYRGTVEFGDEFDESNGEVVPLRTGSERGNGLSFHITIDPNDYLSPILPSYTAKILISDPVDYAEAHLRASIVGIGKVLNMEVKAGVIDTSTTLRSLDINVRRCIYPEETKAGDLYRYHTCVARCKADYIYEFCNCVPFYFPATRYEARRVCELSDTGCVKHHKRDIETSVPKTAAEMVYCGCLPECEDTFYRVKSKSEFLNESLEYKLMKDKQEYVNHTYLNVFYRSNTCTKYRSEAYMVWNELLAANGGTLGLCVGGSVLGILEIFYYVCFNNLRQKNKTQKTNAIEPFNLIPFTN